MAHILREAHRTAPYTYHDFATGQDVTEQRVVSGVAWCSKELHGEFFFLDAEHAKASLDGSVAVCRKCWRAAVKAEVVTPPTTLQIDTWALKV